MSRKTIFTIIIFISIFGMLFSGYLSYYELVVGDCSQAIVSCGKNSVSLTSLPACVYGFVMYFVVFVLAVIGQTIKE